MPEAWRPPGVSPAKPKQKPGRPSKLSLEDQLLLTLEYWREYRTYFHVGQSWGVNESTAYRIVRNIENALSQSRAFSLPGKKQLQGSESESKVVVVDVTESPIERPKKNKSASIVEKRNGTLWNLRWLSTSWVRKSSVPHMPEVGFMTFACSNTVRSDSLQR